jgi:hypothetical protein
VRIYKLLFTLTCVRRITQVFCFKNEVRIDMKEKLTSQYETTDLFLASFLVASRYANLVDIRKNRRHKKVFVFDPGPPQHATLGFYDGSEKVSAIRLTEEYEKLKLATCIFKSNTG